MAVIVHSVSVLDGADALPNGDRIHLSKLTLSYPAGSGNGASVTANIPAGMLIPGTAVFVGNLAAGVSASVSGNTVTVSPAANATLAAGSLAVLLVA